MEIYVEGKKINLTQKDFVAKGGEASIYKRGNVAYKIFENVAKMIPRGKITELSVLDHPSILRPKDVIVNIKKQTIGFTMDWLGESTVPLCKMFVTKFQTDNNISNEMITQLVENKKKVIYFIHKHKCLIVDENELNSLVGMDFVTPYFIDVNSYQTPSYSATAIMPSIRDFTTDKFTTLTDWFSFAILSFQLYIGIHPFKGSHKKYRRNDFMSRIRDRVSVFNPEVELPPSVRSFNSIPSAYKDWFYRVFENGDRTEPPQLPGTAEKIQVKIQVIKDTGLFEIARVLGIDGNILHHNPTFRMTKTQDKVYIRKTSYPNDPSTEIVFTPLEQIPIAVKTHQGLINFTTMTSGYNLNEFNTASEDTMIINNTLYIKNKGKLSEINFRVMGQNIIPSVKTIWNIEENSSKLFSNVVYQSLLGKSFLAIPIPNVSGRSSFYNVPVPELDGQKVIEAKYQNSVCMLITHSNNKYNRVVIKFSKDFSEYKIRNEVDIDYCPLNFTVLDNGVCICITEDGTVEVFFNRLDKDDIKKLQDPEIDISMKLVNDGAILKFYKDNTVYTMRMKN